LYQNHSILSTGSGEGLGFRSSFPTPVRFVFLACCTSSHYSSWSFSFFLFGLLSTNPVQSRSLNVFFDQLSTCSLALPDRSSRCLLWTCRFKSSIASTNQGTKLTTPPLLLLLTAFIYYISTTICSNLAYFTLLLTSPSSFSLLLVICIILPTVLF
jgi:hypothetical protein